MEGVSCAFLYAISNPIAKFELTIKPGFSRSKSRKKREKRKRRRRKTKRSTRRYENGSTIWAGRKPALIWK